MDKRSLILTGVLISFIAIVIAYNYDLEMAIWIIGGSTLLVLFVVLIQLVIGIAVEKRNILFKITESLETLAFIFCGIVLIMGLAELYSEASIISKSAFLGSIIYISYYRYEKSKTSHLKS